MTAVVQYSMPSTYIMYTSSTVSTIHLVFNYLCLTINDLYELLTLRSDDIRHVTKVGYIQYGNAVQQTLWFLSICVRCAWRLWKVSRRRIVHYKQKHFISTGFLEIKRNVTTGDTLKHIIPDNVSSSLLLNVWNFPRF